MGYVEVGDYAKLQAQFRNEVEQKDLLIVSEEFGPV